MTERNDPSGTKDTALSHADGQWAEGLGAELRRDGDVVSSEVHQRLSEARRAAVAAALDQPRLPSGWSLWRWTGAGGVAASLALVTVLAVRGPEPPSDALPRMEGLELALVQDSELLEELEFVAWMVAMEEADEPLTSG